MRPNWRDSRWLNWRIGPRLCVRIVPGLWLSDIIWRRKLQYFAIVLPFLGITFDYEQTTHT